MHAQTCEARARELMHGAACACTHAFVHFLHTALTRVQFLRLGHSVAVALGKLQRQVVLLPRQLCWCVAPACSNTGTYASLDIWFPRRSRRFLHFVSPSPSAVPSRAVSARAFPCAVQCHATSCSLSFVPSAALPCASYHSAKCIALPLALAFSSWA